MKAPGLMILTVIAVCFSAFPTTAIDRTVTGRIEGLNCLIDPDLCARDNKDPHIDLESDFVLLLGNADHYLLPNVPREVKIQFLGQQIKVTGNVSEVYRSITVETLKVRADGQYIDVWSNDMDLRYWQEWRQQFYEKGSDN